MSLSGLVRAQAPNDDPAYVVRGRRTEAHRRALGVRLERVHQVLSETLEPAASDLTESQEPAPRDLSGYGILPPLVQDPPPEPPTPPRVARYSWAWSDTLIAREMQALDQLERELETVSRSSPSPARQDAYAALLRQYSEVERRSRVIDSDIDYNWLWQQRIAANRPQFDALNVMLDAAVARTAQATQAVTDEGPPPLSFDVPSFVRVEHPGAHRTVVRMPVYTDIADAGFVAALVRDVEAFWRARTTSEQYELRVEVIRVTPVILYCGAVGPGGPPTQAVRTDCVPPARGARLDLAAHVARFPDNGAVLTTGATSLQIVEGRALVLGSHDLSPRTLAHEFGHLLGLPDSYLRGYRDLGAGGFEVLEYVADRDDIMCNIGTGAVQARHFEGVVIARNVQRAMMNGLDALYRRHAPTAAIRQFREILAVNPTHYGATLQLAKALDMTGATGEAATWWRRILEMARGAGDTRTTETAQARLVDGSLSERRP